jgi:predicted transcriptional regulator
MRQRERVVSTTTIRIPEELKSRIASAAQRTGKTVHAFILDAIAEKADMEERRQEFERIADQRFADLVSSGETIPWSEMRSYLQARLKGERPQKPVAKKHHR